MEHTFEESESSSDYDEEVQQSVADSLCSIGSTNPDLVLLTIKRYISQQTNIQNAVHKRLNNAVREIFHEHGLKVKEESTFQDWIEICIEAVHTVGMKQDIRKSAYEILVVLAFLKDYLEQVITSLIDLLKMDSVPPENVIKAISMIVSHNSRQAAFMFDRILTAFLPYLAVWQHESLRISIASMFAKLSEGVVDAVANKGPNDTLEIDNFTESSSLMCEVMLNQWLKTQNISLRNEVIFSFSHTSYLLSKEKLEAYTIIILPTMIIAYKRNPNPLIISSSLALLCDALITKKSESSLKLHLEMILNNLFNQICMTPNFNEPQTVKNHCEVLRCFDLLAKSFQDDVVSMLIQRLENASHMQKVGSLVVIKHLINSRSISTDKIERLIIILNASLNDPNSKVIRTLAQVIVALCHTNNLNTKSGAAFIGFLVKHSAGGTLEFRRMSSLNEVGEEFVGNVCCRALNLLATSVTSAVPLLWPQLLRYATLTEYQNSCPTILSCLASLLQHQQGEVATLQGTLFSDSGPTSLPYIFLHLVMVSCSPKSSSGHSALSILQYFPVDVSPNLTKVWEEHLPQLKETFLSLSKNSADPASMQVWQDSLRDFVECSLQSVSRDNFTSRFVSALMDHLEIWGKQEVHRYFIISLFGVTLKHCGEDGLVIRTLNSLFGKINHRCYGEQENFALCVGICGTNHISLVLSCIENWLKGIDSAKRPYSLFSFMKSQDTRVEDDIWAKSTLILSLGQVAALASPEIIFNQVDGPIMLHLLNVINNTKSDIVNDVILETMNKIAKALLLVPECELRQRPLLITHAVNAIKQENPNSRTLSSGLQVLRNLTALKPQLDVEERTTILQASLQSSFTYIQKNMSADSLVDNCYSRLNVLIRTIIQYDANPCTLDDVATLLHSYTTSKCEIVRAKALDLLHSTLCTFIQYLDLSPTGPTKFSLTSQLLAVLSPRLSDPNMEVRHSSILGFELVMKILCRYNGHNAKYTDEDLNSLKTLESSIKITEKSDLEATLYSISKIVCNKLSFVQLRTYVTLVAAGLQDSEESSSSGVAQILSAIFTLRGNQFHQHIPELLDLMFRRLEKVSHSDTKKHAVESVCNLAKHNIISVLDALMSYPLPYSSYVCESFRRIGCESDLCASSLSHLALILERTQLFTEQQNASQEKVFMATLPTLTSVCSIKELLYNLDPKTINASNVNEGENDCAHNVSGSQLIVHERLPSLVALLLLSFGSYIDAVAPLYQSAETSKSAFVPNRDAARIVPSKCALECLQVVVSVGGCKRLEEALTTEMNNPNSDSLDDFLQALSTISVLFAQEAPMHISSLVAYLDTHHNHEIQRMTVASILGELIAVKCCGDYELLEIVTSGLLSKLNDKSPKVRRLVIKGLSNFSRLQNEELRDKMSEVLNALVASTDLREGADALSECQVAHEAMRGLASLLPGSLPTLNLPHAPTLLIRIRLFVENNNGDVREASMGVLRGLSATVGESEEFQEHINLHMLTAIVHLMDPYPPMVVMCKSALRSLAQHTKSVEIETLFSEKLVPSNDLDFAKFVDAFSKILVQIRGDDIGLFLQVITSYFRHSEPNIRCASIQFSAYLVRYSPQSVVDASLPRVCSGVVQLLKDSDAGVRTTAASVVPLIAKHTKIL